MQLKVNNQPNTQSISLAPQTVEVNNPARNSTYSVLNHFGRYNQPTIPLPLFRPGPQPGWNPQQSLPIYMPNDGSPQGNSQQIQPTFGRWGGIWNVPLVPLMQPKYWPITA